MPLPLNDIVRLALNSTAIMEADRENNEWHEVTGALSVESPIESESASAGSSGYRNHGSPDRARRLGSLTLSEVSFGARESLRSEAAWASGAGDDYLLHLVMAGALICDLHDAEFAAKPGDIFVVDLARPFRNVTETGGRLLVVNVPRVELDKLCGNAALHGLWLRAHVPVTTVLSTYLTTLAQQAAKLTGSESAAAQHSLLTLVAGALAERIRAERGHRSISHTTLRKRILHYVDAHLSEPDLGPEQIMDRFRISRAHLYRAFEADGGIAGIIRDKRLDLAWRLLVSSPGRRQSIKALSFDCGFSSSETFRRNFKQRFDALPADVHARFGRGEEGVRKG